MPEDPKPGIEDFRNGPPGIEPAQTSITAIIGNFNSSAAERPVLLTSEADLNDKLNDNTSPSAQAVAQFFVNGGRECWVVCAKPTEPKLDRVEALKSAIESLDQIDAPNLLSIAAASELDATECAEVIAFAAELCKTRNSFLLVDPPTKLHTPDDILTWLDGNPALRIENAALYFPWVRIADRSNPAQQVRLPPSTTMAGVIARVDLNRGVWKAPAGREATLIAVAGLDYSLSDKENDRLNRHGVNCLRTFPDSGPVCWGARTVSLNNEWRYVPVRRLALFIERSIYQSTQWAIFEPNAEALWANVRAVIEDFLVGLWRQGALAGIKPEEAFFVKCDRTTMTQNDLDNGRLIALVGIAPLKPSEFVIIRIELMTAGASEK
ncbi:MAG TPA: phage tail sheath C-terminal domain-containing protein [Pyrinomonadaceae bacterium]|nr:phage tail sheath C-terminal domain-containing protein [Pyrinomonadaceae bacterium]